MVSCPYMAITKQRVRAARRTRIAFPISPWEPTPAERLLRADAILAARGMWKDRKIGNVVAWQRSIRAADEKRMRKIDQAWTKLRHAKKIKRK